MPSRGIPPVSRRALIGRGRDVVDALSGCWRRDGVGHGQVVADVRRGGGVPSCRDVFLNTLRENLSLGDLGIEIGDISQELYDKVPLVQELLSHRAEYGRGLRWLGPGRAAFEYREAGRWLQAARTIGEGAVVVVAGAGAGAVAEALGVVNQMKNNGSCR